MKKQLFLLFILVPLFSFGQKYSLKGTIMDSVTNKPLEYVTTAIFKQKTSKAVKVIYSDDKGVFELTELPKDTYRLELLSVGYRSIVMQNIVLQGNKNLEIVNMNPVSKALQDVVVTAQKAIIENTGDKLIYNAENDAAAQGGNAIEILRKIPFITVDQDDNIELKGQTNFLIQLNGRSTGMFAKNPKDALRGMPASMIKKIEIITNPGAKYDADGTAGIINIITDKKVAGYNGNVSLSYNTLNQANLNFNINVKQGKWGISSYVGLSDGHNYNRFESGRTNFIATTFARQTQIGTGKSKNRNLYGNIEIAYDIDSLRTLSLYGFTSQGAWKSDNRQDFLVYDQNSNIQSQAIRNASFKNAWPSLELGVDYIQKFKKPDQEWTISINKSKSYGENSSSSDLDYSAGGKDRFLRGATQNNDVSLTAQTDFVLPIEKDKKSLSFGAKILERHPISDYFQEQKDSLSENYFTNKKNTDVLDYLQKVYASYLSYTYKWQKKLSISPGFRYEYTQIEGKFGSGTTPAFGNSYPSYIPTMSLNFTPKLGKTFRFSYSRRIQRPGIWYLNPYINNDDPRNISYGNPNLLPEYTNSFESGFNFFQKGNNISITLMRGITNNVINSFTSIDKQTGVATTTNQNIGKSERTAVTISLSGNIKGKIQCNSNFTFAYLFISGNNGIQSYKNTGFQASGYGNLTYTLAKKWKINASGNIGSPRFTLQGRNSSWWNYQLSLNRTFLKNDVLRLGLNADNFLHKERVWSNTVNDPFFSSFSNSYQPARAIRLSVSYRFGKLKENVSRKKGVSNDDQKSGGN